jgi:dTDP-4-dehydrorhamnose reductase
MTDTFDHVLNIRLRMPINDDIESPRNFISKILRYEKICSIKNSMTVLPDVIPIMIDMIQMKKTGTINLTNPGTISHNEILDMYTYIIDPTFTYQNFSLEEQAKVLRSDRSNNKLDTSHLQSEYFILPIYESIQRLFKRIRKKKIMEKREMIQTVLVTGGFGFIGSNFIHFLTQERPNWKIINIDKVCYCSDREHLSGLSVESYEIDINDMDDVLHILEKHDIDCVIHFAAQSHVVRGSGRAEQHYWAGHGPAPRARFAGF